jgi:hypothetical protein
MLSIIISSCNPGYFDSLVNNIRETIGSVNYEIIRVSNPGIMNLSQAYNTGAKEAKFDNFLFLHEDVKFLKKEWGVKVLKLLQIQNLGLLGLAGGLKKFKMPTGHDSGIGKYRQVYVVHKPNEKIKSDASSQLIEVKTLDGVFLAMTKERWNELRFNEDLQGFHFYDLDISLRASQDYQNYVTAEIPLLHFSLGKFNNPWIEAAFAFHKRNYTYNCAELKERKIIRSFWFRRLLSEDISIRNRMKYVLNMGIDGVSWKHAVNFILSRRVLK